MRAVTPVTGEMAPLSVSFRQWPAVKTAVEFMSVPPQRNFTDPRETVRATIQG